MFLGNLLPSDNSACFIHLSCFCMVFCSLIAAAVLELTATFLQPVKFEAEIIALQTCLSKHPEASLLYVEHVWHR
jgi:hypothetical protein